jgi:hypothetical protein
MEDFKTYRDPEASLWQSAVEEAAARHAGALGAAALPHLPSLRRLADQAGALIHGLNRLVPGAAAVGGAVSGLAAGLNDPSLIGAVVASLARTFTGSADAFRGLVRQAPFSRLDPFWVEAAVSYYLILQQHRADVPYRHFQDLGDFVLDPGMPSPVRIAMVSDWGTGTDDAWRVLRQAVAKQPQLLIHLGDIYYAGTAREVETRFWNVVQAVLAEAGNPPVRVCTLSGNHDMYSGGAPYYGLIDRLGQPASYFCLRNDHWQVVAMDTGRNSGYTHLEGTSLDPDEVVWVRDKVQNAGPRKTVLLSHHQPFAAFEQVGPEPNGINPNLWDPFKDLTDAVTFWFWGHEHDLVVYEPVGALRCRAIGYGAVPEPAPLNPDEPRPVQPGFTLTGVRDVRARVAPPYYEHGYVILDLAEASAAVRYYQISDEQTPVFEESVP